MLQNQGLFGIAFFEATASVVLLVLFSLFRRDDRSLYFRSWLVGWAVFTLSCLASVALTVQNLQALAIFILVGHFLASILFFVSIIQFTAGSARVRWSILPLGAVVLVAVYYLEARWPQNLPSPHWATALLESLVLLSAGWTLWRVRSRFAGHGAQLLAGLLLASGLHRLDRPMWHESPVYLVRLAFDDLFGVALGIAMVVVVLENARSRTGDLNDKMRRLTLLTAASTQSMSVQDVLDSVLSQVVQSLSATHGVVWLIAGEGTSASLSVRASVGFTEFFITQHQQLSLAEPWAQKLLQGGSGESACLFRETDPQAWSRIAEPSVNEMVTVVLRGKSGPLGIVGVGSNREDHFQPDEVAYLVNIANLLGLTLQNVRLFEQIALVQKQWANTFDSIGDPVLVHDGQGHVLRANQRLSNLLARDFNALVGRAVNQLLPRNGTNFQVCPYCEGVAGQGDDPDPWLHGYFLASTSAFGDAAGNNLGTVHVLKDITDRKRAEEKYRTLVSNVQEGVFISTPQGRFLDFNDALLRMTGYESRDELLSVNIPSSIYVNGTDRERLKKLLQDHGSVADFEFEMRRKDGEVRTVMESSIAVREASGAVTAYQGFVLDITERKRAEQEIRRRNRELLVLNSIAQTLTESMDLTDSLRRTLNQLSELFSLDTSSLYLFADDGNKLRRVATVGQRSGYARHLAPVTLQPEFLQHIKAVHATFLSVQGLPLPQALLEALKKEGIVSAYIVVLWSKDRPLGGLVVGSRTPREFSPADVNLLIAVGSQISNATERVLLYDEARAAYENLRRTQEQLLNSEKMAAVGQLISGVAHELNNPLTAILGYSQLLIGSGQVGPQGIEYTEKLYKQAQRTHRIVQNLLSFARQHKPERLPTRINQILVDTLALRDYDLRMSNIRIHLDLAEDLPEMAADPHQLQQVFLNMVNNAVDAILEASTDGDLWVSTRSDSQKVYVEFTDSGPGVQEASRVFDPFYTTKPVGKGTGLGLSICYGIVTEHGGTINVRNLPQRGASFTIELPYAASDGDNSAHSPSAADVAAKEPLVLCVDNDDANLKLLQDVLQAQGYQVLIARSPKELHAAIHENHIDAIVMDVDMPEGNSAKTMLDFLLESQPEFSPRVVRMVPAASWHAAYRPDGAGPRTLLKKPVDPAHLLDALDSILSVRAQPTVI